jgi:hypothetical protein
MRLFFIGNRARLTYLGEKLASRSIDCKNSVSKRSGTSLCAAGMPDLR